MYLTTSRPDIMSVVCTCVRYQAAPKELHLVTMKRIFVYRKGKRGLALWYQKDGDFSLYAFTDSDFGGCNNNRKYKKRGCQFLGSRLVS